MFSNLKFLDVEDLPLAELKSNLPPITVLTSCSLHSFLDEFFAHLLEIVSYKLHHIETYNDNLAIAACETAASFMINGSSRNLDYNLLKKLGPCTMTYKRRNFITLAAFLSNTHTALHSDALNVRQYAISQNISKSIEVCSEFWKGLALREENFTLVNAANLVVYMFKNEITVFHSIRITLSENNFQLVSSVT